MEVIPISVFKATCLSVLETVRRTGQPVLVTRRGLPVAEVGPPAHQGPEGRRLGIAAARGRIVGDIVSPVTGVENWEATFAPADAR
jgi:prevent-host-death family protein